MTSQLWRSTTAGVGGANQLIPLNFSIPARLTSSVVGINLVDKTTVQIPMNPPLILPDNCCIELIQASFSYTYPNIADSTAQLASIPFGNNRMTVTFGVNPAVDILVPTGLYSFGDVQQYLNSYAIGAGWVPPTAASQQLFILSGIEATQQLVITIDPLALASGVVPAGGIILNFTNPSIVSGLNNSIGTILGFPVAGAGAILTVVAATTTPTSFQSPTSADFAQISAYVLNMSIVTNSYRNSNTSQVLFSFPLGQFATNSVASWQSSLRFPVPCSGGTYSSVSIWLTDNVGNRLSWEYFQSPFQFSALISRVKADGSI